LILLRELGWAEVLDRHSAMRRSAEAFISAQSKADEELRISLDRSLDDARQDFKIVTGMDIAVFVAGFALLSISIYLVLDAKAARLIGMVGHLLNFRATCISTGDKNENDNFLC